MQQLPYVFNIQSVSWLSSFCHDTAKCENASAKLSLSKLSCYTVVVDLDLPSVSLSVLANGMNRINATYNKMMS